MSAEANHTGSGLGRSEVVEILAEVSHRTWLRQKVRDQGADAADLDKSVTDHDLERAEDAVMRLEELGLLRFTP